MNYSLSYYLYSATHIIKKPFNYFTNKKSQWSNKQEWLDHKLKLAALNNDTQLVQALLNAGANANAQDDDGQTPLHKATFIGNTYLSLQALLEAGANPNATDKNDKTPLHMALLNDNTQSSQTFINGGADIPIVLQQEYTNAALNLAVVGYTQSIQALLDAGANPNIELYSNDSFTPLHLAAAKGYTQLVQALLNAGADPTAKDNNGKTPLHMAALNNDTQLVQALLNAGANANAQDADGQTPLHKATFIGNTYLSLQALLNAGADPNATDKNGKTPLHFAVIKDNIHSVNLLIDKGANVDAQDADGQTPLQSLIKYHIQYSQYYSQKKYCGSSDSCIDYVDKKWEALLDKMFATQDHDYPSLMHSLLTQKLIPENLIYSLANRMKEKNIEYNLSNFAHATLHLQNLIQYAKHSKMALEDSIRPNKWQIETEGKIISTFENILEQRESDSSIQKDLPFTTWLNHPLFVKWSYHDSMTRHLCSHEQEGKNVSLIGNAVLNELDVD